MGTACFCGGRTISMSTPSSFPTNSSVFEDTSTTESQVQWKTPFAATITGMQAWVGGSTATTATFRKNGANGNNTITATPGAGATAWVVDSTHSDTLAVNDLFDIQFTGTATTSQRAGVGILFDASPNQVFMLSAIGQSLGTLTNGTFFCPLSSTRNITTTEAGDQNLIRSPGTLSYFQINVSTSNAASKTINFRKNAANGNSLISYTGGTTGLFVDTTHTDTLANGDKICWSVALTTADSFFMGVAAFVNTSGTTYDFTSGDLNQSTGGTSPINWNIVANTDTSLNQTETFDQMTIPYNGFTLSNLRVLIQTGANASTMHLRKNGANANQAATITASTTGWFEDTTNSYCGVSCDKWTYQGTTTTGLMICGMMTVKNPSVTALRKPLPVYLRR